MRCHRSGTRHDGMALLTAMLTVALVATLASAALWQQWRSVEIEGAERSRLQMQWVLNGALDWARLILREDARDGAVDHLSEPWALPLQEARLSSFLAQDKNNTEDSMDAFLSGAISDQQALLNVRNLVQDGKANEGAQRAFTKLFRQLNLPPTQVQLLVDGLIASDAADKDSQPDTPSVAPLHPARMEQLLWLGLPPATLQALKPYATLLPVATPVNLNTASATVIYAAVPELDMARAQQMLNHRATAHFKAVSDAWSAAGLSATAIGKLDGTAYAVGTQYFAVRGRLRLGDAVVQELSLVERSGNLVKVLWRQREALSAQTAASLQ